VIVERYPSRDEIDAFAQQWGLNPEWVVKDVVRLAAIHHMLEQHFLNDDCVLTGGMALRCWGSTRFTIKDTDTSSRHPLDELELQAALKIETDELTVNADKVESWDRRQKLTIALPVEYEAYFASIGFGDPVSDEFEVTVNMRGLFRGPVWMRLRHPYTSLKLPDADVPVMNPSEQTAEKICAWVIHGLAKHYVDLGFIAKHCRQHLDYQDLATLIKKKLDRGHELKPDSYINYRSVESVVVPLFEPRDHVAPLNDHGLQPDEVRFIGDRIGFEQARQLVCDRIIKPMFPSNS
jgi:hypothetical protein